MRPSILGALIQLAGPEPVDSLSTDETTDAGGSEPAVPERTPWVLGGFVDIAYQGNTNAPANHVWRGMFSSPRTNEPMVNLGALYVRRDAGPGDPFHIEVAFQVGPASDSDASGEPTPGGPDSHFAGPETFKHIARANTGLTLKTGTDISAGLMVSPIGVGIFWTPTNWHYTTPWSLNGVPYHLLGARVSQKVGDMVEVQGWVVNGWQTLGDVNIVPSYMAGLLITPRRDLVIQEMAYFGPEDEDPSARAWRTFFNTQVIWSGERIGAAALFDIGRERLTGIHGAPVALWTAVMGDLRWKVLGGDHTWHMATRGGGYWDRDGRMYGVPTWLIEAVYTNDVRLFDHLLLRLEYRYDHATAREGYFYRGDATSPLSAGLAQDQHTLIGAVTGSFELGLPRVRARP